MNMNAILEDSELGKKSSYTIQYDPKILFAISRKQKRNEIGINDELPFFGFDIWNHYEVSWLNNKGKPIVALAEIIYGCNSQAIIESKSMKLYFNSINNIKFDCVESVQSMIKNDFEERLNSIVKVRISPLQIFKDTMMNRSFEGIYLDTLDIDCDAYRADPSYLSSENEIVNEVISSDLLKSNCLVTGQPDWASIQISYEGKKINHEGLLRYLISFSNDNEFHEQCIEKIFMHILTRCQPKDLTIYGRSTRRGGIDINAYRSTKEIDSYLIPNIRLCRQ